MTPEQLSRAATEIGERYPDALIYTNPPPTANGHVRNPGVPVGALAVDVDRVWPHTCVEDDCTDCYGWYELVAWINRIGEVHWVMA